MEFVPTVDMQSDGKLYAGLNEVEARQCTGT